MPVMRTMFTVLAIAVMPALFSTHALAATTVTASLWDKGADSMNMMDEARPMGMAMMPADQMVAMMPMLQMGITLDRVEVPAGEVTFSVTNASKDIIHEMILSPIADEDTPLPYVPGDLRVDEEASGALGEVSELDPGKSGALTVTLTPGKYMLYCNIPGHYILGMWVVLTVTE